MSAWLALSGSQLLPDGKLQLDSSAHNEPPIVAPVRAPAFVRLAIEQALDHGWQPARPGASRSCGWTIEPAGSPKSPNSEGG